MFGTVSPPDEEEDDAAYDVEGESSGETPVELPPLSSAMITRFFCWEWRRQRERKAEVEEGGESGGSEEGGEETKCRKGNRREWRRDLYVPGSVGDVGEGEGEWEEKGGSTGTETRSWRCSVRS